MLLKAATGIGGTAMSLKPIIKVFSITCFGCTWRTSIGFLEQPRPGKMEVQVFFRDPPPARLFFALDLPDPPQFRLQESVDGSIFSPGRAYDTIRRKKIIELAVPLKDLSIDLGSRIQLV